MKKILSILSIVFIFATIACSSAFAIEPANKAIARSVLDPFDFSLYVSTDDDNATTEFALRDTDTFGYNDPYIGFRTLQNAANSMHFCVYKWNPYGGYISGTATNTVTIQSNSTTSISPRYTDEYIMTSGAFKLHAWTTIRDCYAAGNWTP